MPRYAKRRGRKVGRGRYSQKSKKSLTRVVKATVTRMAETKELSYTYDSIGGGSASFASIGYGANIAVGTLCAGIVQGTTGSSRIGRRIFLRGIQIRVALAPGDNTNNLRFLLVRQRGQADLTNNANFAVDLFAMASSGTQWLAQVDTDKYQVLMDKNFFMRFSPVTGEAVAGNTAPNYKFLRKFIKINKPIEYQSTTGASPLRDYILVAISDSAVVAHPGAVAGFVKLYWTDS